MISSIISRVVILVFGTLYPAYASYKAVRTKNVKEYVKWMMYWIVFALFTCAETFTDVFFSWFPFYYEVKILLVLWLLSPATKGSSILYRKFVHPALCRREQEIDEYILKAKDQGYHTVLNLGTKGVNYATNVIMQTALKGGGGLVQQLRKSYSLSDLTSEDHQDGQQAQLMQEAQDTVTDARLLRRSVSSRRAPPARVDMLFPEVDTARSTRGRESANLAHIRSSEDISSAYAPDGSSIQEVLTRTTSVGGVSRTRSKVTRSTFTSIKRPAAAEDGEIIIEEFDDEDVPQYILDNPTDFDLPTDSNQSNQSSSGAVCLPYSKNIIDQYLRLIMHENLQQSQTEDATDLNYKKYLELKKIFDSNENLSKKKDVKPDEPEEEKRSGEEKKTSNLDSSKDAPCLDPSKDAVIVEPSKNSPLSKKSNNAPLTEPSKDASFLETSKATPFIHVSEIKTKIEEEREMKGDSDLEKPAFLDQSKTMSEESRSIGASSSNLSSDDEDEIDFTTPNSSPILKQKSNKGGKYKKRHAPPPPKDITSSQSDRNESDKDTNNCEKEGTKISLPEEKQDRVSPIRATLVLKPGVVKEIGPSVDSSGKYTEVFVSHSPIKRRHRQKNRSPARKSVSSSPISKLMHLPAKFAFWNKNDESVEGSSNRSNSVSSSIINDDESNESNTNDDNSLMSDFGSSVDMKSLSESDTVCVETEKTPKTKVVSEKSSKIIDSEDDQIFEDADENAGEGKEIKKDEAVKVEIKIDGGKENVREVQEMKFNPLSSDYVHIPLKLETLAIHTESRSTDV